jgi:hypothetical protein
MILVVCINCFKVKEREKGKGRGMRGQTSKLSYESSEVQKKYEKVQWAYAECCNVCLIGYLHMVEFCAVLQTSALLCIANEMCVMKTKIAPFLRTNPNNFITKYLN